MTDRHVCSSTFRYDGRQVTITMTDPWVSPEGNAFPVPMAASVLWRSVEPDGMLPVATDGVIVPATYRVEGLAYELTVTTKGGKFDDAPEYHGVMLDTVSVHYGNDHEQPDTFRLPTKQLRYHAVRAATVRGLWLPPGTQWHDATWSVSVNVDDNDTEGFHVFTGFGPGTAAERVRDAEIANLAGLPRKRKRRNAEQLEADLIEAAELWKSSVHGERAAVIASALCVSDRTANDYIRKARERGLIPPTDPNDGRTRANRKGTK